MRSPTSKNINFKVNSTRGTNTQLIKDTVAAKKRTQGGKLMAYCYTKKTLKPFNETEQSTKEALKKRNFGIITEIDAQKIIKEKIGKDIPAYKILGTCNPNFAHQAITTEPNIGVLLPCNVLLRTEKEYTVISAILPSVQLGKVENPKLRNLAEQVEHQLKEAVDEACQTR